MFQLGFLKVFDWELRHGFMYSILLASVPGFRIHNRELFASPSRYSFLHSNPLIQMFRFGSLNLSCSFEASMSVYGSRIAYQIRCLYTSMRF